MGVGEGMEDSLARGVSERKRGRKGMKGRNAVSEGMKEGEGREEHDRRNGGKEGGKSRKSGGDGWREGRGSVRAHEEEGSIESRVRQHSNAQNVENRRTGEVRASTRIWFSREADNSIRDMKSKKVEGIAALQIRRERGTINIGTRTFVDCGVEIMQMLSVSCLFSCGNSTPSTDKASKRKERLLLEIARKRAE